MDIGSALVAAAGLIATGHLGATWVKAHYGAQAEAAFDSFEDDLYDLMADATHEGAVKALESHGLKIVEDGAKLAAGVLAARAPAPVVPAPAPVPAPAAPAAGGMAAPTT